MRTDVETERLRVQREQDWAAQRQGGQASPDDAPAASSAAADPDDNVAGLMAATVEAAAQGEDTDWDEVTDNLLALEAATTAATTTTRPGQNDNAADTSADANHDDASAGAGADCSTSDGAAGTGTTDAEAPPASSTGPAAIHDEQPVSGESAEVAPLTQELAAEVMGSSDEDQDPERLRPISSSSDSSNHSTESDASRPSSAATADAETAVRMQAALAASFASSWEDWHPGFPEKARLAERLFRQVAQTHSNCVARKATSMLLEMDTEALEPLLDSEDALEGKVKETLHILALRQSKKDQEADRAYTEFRGPRFAPPRQRKLTLLDLPEPLLAHILSYSMSHNRIDKETFQAMLVTCKRFERVLDQNPVIWRDVGFFNWRGKLHMECFRRMGVTVARGTEGICYKVFSRYHRRVFAMRQARMHPVGEGIPYYMLRELAVLRNIAHEHVCTPEHINFDGTHLHLFFEHFDVSLHDFIEKHSKVTKRTRHGGVLKDYLPNACIQPLMHQLLCAVHHIHGMGIVHRNIKPKHLLIQPGSNPRRPLEGAHLRLADFALVRMMGYPPRQYTSEVVTLWYRPPEILMGEKKYLPAVDMWSVGCVFAEVLQLIPLFMGSSEIDQLFQIFQCLTTPTAEEWNAFSSLPYYQPSLFPDWKHNRLAQHVPRASTQQLAFVQRCLTFDPRRRMDALEALNHPVFTSASAKPRMPKTVEELHPSLSAAGLTVLQSVPHSVTQLYSFLLTNQCPVVEQEEHYLQRQHTITETDRLHAVTWLMSIVDNFEDHMSLRTFHFGVALMDYYVAGSKSLSRTELAMLAAAAVHVASKCEDVSYIGVDDLCSLSEQKLTLGSVLEMETALINRMDCDIYIPTAMDFLRILLNLALPGREDVFCLSCLLSELALVDICMLTYPPSTIATAVIVLALHMMGLDPWPVALANIAPCSLREAEPVVRHIHDVRQRVQRQERELSQFAQILRPRYDHPGVLFVYTVVVPPVLTIDFSGTGTLLAHVPAAGGGRGPPTGGAAAPAGAAGGRQPAQPEEGAARARAEAGAGAGTAGADVPIRDDDAFDLPPAMVAFIRALTGHDM